MGIYFFLLLLIWVIYMLRGRFYVANSGFFSNEIIRKKTKNSLIVIGIVLFIISAFRATTVGIDTSSYLWTYERIGLYLPDLSISFFSEDGYTLLEYVCRGIGVGFRGILVFSAAIYIFPILYMIYKYSKNPYLSLFYFVTLDYYCFSMSGMRQSIAIGLCIIAFEMAQRKRLLLFLLFVGIAVTFHSTSIVFVPVYFLRHIPIKRKYIYPFIALGFLCYVFRGSIVSIIQTMSRIYYSNMETGGTGMYLYMLIAVILAFMYSPEWADDNNSSKSLITYMMIMAIIMFPILQFNPTAFRLHYYYSIVIILFIPTVLRDIRRAKMRFLFTCFFFLVAAYYFMEYPMRNMGVNPYMFGL